MMDDWPSVMYKSMLAGALLRRRPLHLLQALIDRSACTLAISAAMAEEYRGRYGRDFEYFHNPVDLAMWNRVARSDWSPGVPFTLRYTGHVSRSNLSSLLDIARAVESLRSKGRDVVLEVVTRDSDDDWLASMVAHEGTTVLPAGPYADVPSVLATADVLALPYAFGGDGRAYSRLSMPTKAAEYMASGTPILVYAPKDSAVAEYAHQGGFAVLVGMPDADLLARSICLLMDDETLRRRMGEFAKAQSESHDGRVVRAQFQAVMCRAAGGSDGQLDGEPARSPMRT
jgi:glycosyltransferase involved in cell wall biosynthesis